MKVYEAMMSKYDIYDEEKTSSQNLCKGCRYLEKGKGGIKKCKLYDTRLTKYDFCGTIYEKSKRRI